MKTAILSIIDEGQALNLCGVSLVVDCHEEEASVTYKLKAKLCEDIEEITHTVNFTRKGYNYNFKAIPTKKATHYELELVSVTGVSVVYSSILSALSKVPLC